MDYFSLLPSTITGYGAGVAEALLVLSGHIKQYAMHGHFVSAAGAGVGTLTAIKVMIADLIALTRMVFNPLFFGAFFLVVSICAWFRMEAIAERKRTNTNVRILAKKSISQLHMSLREYSDKYNGNIFETNGFTEVINSMVTKGKTPLKAASICQPVVPSIGENVLWKSNCMRILTDPVADGNAVKSKFFEAVRQKTVLSIRDALHIVALGGEVHWKDTRGLIFSKDRLVTLKFNFFDPDAFMCIYLDRHGFKRVCAESVKNFFRFQSADHLAQEIVFDKIHKIRVPDETFFSALALLVCYGEPL